MTNDLMTLREKISKFLRLGTKFYCVSCDQPYRVWGAKRNIEYFCQTCPTPLIKNRKNKWLTKIL